MRYRLVMAVRNHPGFDAKLSEGPSRTVVTCIAGCRDEKDAKEKARALYDVETFRSVEEKPE